MIGKSSFSVELLAVFLEVMMLRQMVIDDCLVLVSVHPSPHLMMTMMRMVMMKMLRELQMMKRRMKMM